MKNTIQKIGMVLFLLAFFANITAWETGTKKLETRMNVLFIAVDDLKPNLGCYGNTLAITPNIDFLASNGTIMTANYCQQAVCAPSRISLFTGMRPDYTGILDLQTNMRDINPEILTLPEFFKNQGYVTAGFGKLMHGAKRNDPQSWSVPYMENDKLTYADGFDYPANGRYQSPASHKIYQQAMDENLNWKETNDLMKAKGVSPASEFLDVPDDAYTDGAIANEGIKLLEKFSKIEKPFFLALGFMKPHLPFVAPEKYLALYENTAFELAPFREKASNSPDIAYTTWGELRGYSDIPSRGALSDEKQLELIQAYYASVSYVDAQIGKVYRKLEELGMADNTIIVLWGDHGWHLGDHGLWCKHTNFEQATHAPLIFSAPGFKGKQVSNSMTEFVDIFPTLCELTGMEEPAGLEGMSLVPVLQNPENKVKEYSISQYPRSGDIMGYSLRTGQYRLTWWIKNYSDKSAVYEVYARELYDYKKDPDETVSVSGDKDYKNVEYQLSKKMKDYLDRRKFSD